MCINHLLDGIQIVLQVGIDGNHGIGPFTGSHHASHDGVLVTHIASETDATYIFVFLVQAFYQRPSAVATAVVYKHHHAVGTDLLFLNQFFKQGGESFYGRFQYQFFVVTG